MRSLFKGVNVSCKEGYHDWKIVDVKAIARKGEVITKYKCKKCGKTKTEITKV